MSNVKRALIKLFSNPRERSGNSEQPVEKISIEERLLNAHLERERKKRIRTQLQSIQKKHWKEMTSTEMPHHARFRQLNRIKKRKRR